MHEAAAESEQCIATLSARDSAFNRRARSGVAADASVGGFDGVVDAEKDIGRAPRKSTRALPLVSCDISSRTGDTTVCIAAMDAASLVDTCRDATDAHTASSPWSVVIMAASPGARASARLSRRFIDLGCEAASVAVEAATAKVAVATGAEAAVLLDDLAILLQLEDLDSSN